MQLFTVTRLAAPYERPLPYELSLPDICIVIKIARYKRKFKSRGNPSVCVCVCVCVSGGSEGEEYRPPRNLLYKLKEIADNVQAVDNTMSLPYNYET